MKVDWQRGRGNQAFEALAQGSSASIVLRTITANWPHYIPFIATDPDHIIVYQPFNYGMTNIVAICFDQQQLHDRTNSLLDVIYHEIGHCYHYAQGGWTLADYRERPLIRAECEAKAMRFSERWRNMIRFNAGMGDSLTSNPLLIRASKWFLLEPLKITSEG